MKAERNRRKRITLGVENHTGSGESHREWRISQGNCFFPSKVTRTPPDAQGSHRGWGQSTLTYCLWENEFVQGGRIIRIFQRRCITPLRNLYVSQAVDPLPELWSKETRTTWIDLGASPPPPPPRLKTLSPAGMLLWTVVKPFRHRHPGHPHAIRGYVWIQPSTSSHHQCAEPPTTPLLS